MTPHLGLQRTMIPGSQVSSLTTGTIALAGAKKPSWNPEGAYDALASTTVGVGGVASVTFSGIPSGYKHLQLRGIGITTNNIGIQFNYDTGENYTYHRFLGNGSSASAGGATITGRTLATFVSGANTSYPAAFITDILDYNSTSKLKTMRTLCGHDENTTTGEVAIYSNLYVWGTLSITSITLKNENGSNLGQFSHFSLYGIK